MQIRIIDLIERPNRTPDSTVIIHQATTIAIENERIRQHLCFGDLMRKWLKCTDTDEINLRNQSSDDSANHQYLLIIYWSIFLNIFPRNPIVVHLLCLIVSTKKSIFSLKQPILSYWCTNHQSNCNFWTNFWTSLHGSDTRGGKDFIQLDFVSNFADVPTCRAIIIIIIRCIFSFAERFFELCKVAGVNDDNFSRWKQKKLNTMTEQNRGVVYNKMNMSLFFAHLNYCVRLGVVSFCASSLRQQNLNEHRLLFNNWP